MKKLSFIIFFLVITYNAFCQYGYGYELFPKEWGYPETTKLVYDETIDNNPNKVLFFNQNHIIKYVLNRTSIIFPGTEGYFVRWYTQINKGLICRYNYTSVDIPKVALFDPNQIEKILPNYEYTNIDYFLLSNNGSCIWLRGDDDFSIICISNRTDPSTIYTQYEIINIGTDKVEILYIKDHLFDPFWVLSPSFSNDSITLLDLKTILYLDTNGNQTKYQSIENGKTVRELNYSNIYNSAKQLIQIITSDNNGSSSSTNIMHY